MKNVLRTRIFFPWTHGQDAVSMSHQLQGLIVRAGSCDWVEVKGFASRRRMHNP